MSEKLIALIIICIFLCFIGCIITVIIIKPSRLKIKARIKDSEIAIDLDNNKRN